MGWKSSLATVEELRKQKADEMKEFEKYMEHVRTLAEEREALTQEMEQENEGLKAQLQHVQQQLLGKCESVEFETTFSNSLSNQLFNLCYEYQYFNLHFGQTVNGNEY